MWIYLLWLFNIIASNMHLSTGIQGENEAASYLVSHGYQILHRNYRTKAGELDIVAQKNATIYFIEVKTRTSERYGKPYESVTHTKQAHMKRAAQWYVLQNKIGRSKLKLSVVSVLIQGESVSIQMYEFD